MSLSRGVAARIIEILNAEPSRTFSIPEIHRAIADPQRQLRSTARQLQRMARNGLILSPFRGYFQSRRASKLPILTMRDLRFHGTVLEVNCRKVGRETSRPLRQQATSERWHTLERMIRARFRFTGRIEENQGLRFVGEWHGRRSYALTMMLYPSTETGMIWIRGASPKAMHLLDFTSYLSFWPSLTGVPPEFWILRQLDANIDVKGVSSSVSFSRRMSISQALTLIVRWYQKEAELLRMESRVMGFFPVQELTDLFAEVVRFSDVLRFARGNDETL